MLCKVYWAAGVVCRWILGFIVFLFWYIYLQAVKKAKDCTNFPFSGQGSYLQDIHRLKFQGDEQLSLSGFNLGDRKNWITPE
jgi:hypothetical protein